MLCVHVRVHVRTCTCMCIQHKVQFFKSDIRIILCVYAVNKFSIAGQQNNNREVVLD